MKCGLFIALIVLLTSTLGANEIPPTLIKCPDCPEMVSYRAVSCPYCGCPGNAIHAKYEAMHPRPQLVQDPVVWVRTNTESGYALCIEDQGRKYLLVDADLLNGADLIEFRLQPNNLPLEVASMEVSDSYPIARFAITATNVATIVVSKQSETTPARYLKVDKEGVVVQSKALPTSETAEFWGTDAQSHLLATSVRDRGSLVVVDYREVGDWGPIRPLQFRDQTGLLETAGTASSAALSSKLRRTKWARSYLADRAVQILR